MGSLEKEREKLMNNNFWKGKKVIITGANGFLASHLTISLLEKKAVVIGIIKEAMPFSYLDLSLKEKKYSNLRIVKGDIVDHGFIKRLFK